MAEEKNNGGKTVWKQRAQLYGGVLLMLVFCVGIIWVYRVLTNGRNGLLPVPKEDVVPLSPTFYAQQDPLWAGEDMGETGYTIGEEGSLLCCLSMAASLRGVETNPSALNQAASYSGNALQLNSLTNGGPLEGLRFKPHRDFTEEKLRKLLETGTTPLARIEREGQVRWLLVVGAQDGAFLVLDPAGEAQPVPLTENVYVAASLE